MAKRNTEMEIHAVRSARNIAPRWIAGACTLALVAFAAAGRSQSPAPAPPAPSMGGDRVYFVGFEGNMDRRTVTGAPYSADVTSEFTQTLSDGTVIDRKTTGMVARDGQGRTRRETTLPAIGPFATSGAPPTMISINDPVAHKRYMLDPKDKTARELGGGPGMHVIETKRLGGDAPPPAPPAGGKVFIMRDAGGPGEGRDAGPDVGPGGGPDGDDAGREGMRGGDGATTASLGTQTMEGVTVEGTRTTRTIPAGAIGNQQPILITFERWYSPDLLTDIKTVRSDPFTGKTTFMLTNLKRGEPDASLFTVPADYKMVTDMPGRISMGGAPGAGGKGGWMGRQRMQVGPGMPPNPGDAPNSNMAPPPPAAPGQGQDD